MSTSFSDENDFRNLVSWLEDQKIRNYSIDDRADLRDFASTNWNDTFAKVSLTFPPAAICNLTLLFFNSI